MVSASVYPVFVRMEVAPVTGSSTTMVDPFDTIVFTNGSTTAAQTVVLPTNVFDGKIVTISNVSAITALTLTPATSGVPAGLTAGQGLTLMYSSTFATPGWFVLKG